MVKKDVNIFIYVPGIIISFFLQTSLLPKIFPEGIIPNLLLAILIVAAYLSEREGIFYSALAAGYLFDIYSGKYFGAVMISFLIVVFTMMYASRYLLKDQFSLNVVASGMICAIIYNTSYYLASYAINFGTPAFEVSALIVSSLTDSFFVAILFYPLAYIFSSNANGE